MFHEFCDEAEGLLDGDAAHQTHHMGILPLCYLLHHLNLHEEVPSLTTTGRYCVCVCVFVCVCECVCVCVCVWCVCVCVCVWP